MKSIWIGAVALMIAIPALAEKADANKQAEISANAAVGDLVNQGVTATGNVILTKGTIEIKAGKATVVADAEGYYFTTFWADPGGLVTFRQKRDGGDIWVEGEAERVEYHEKQEAVKFYNKAKVRETEAGRLLTQASGAFISYDARKEQVAALNQANGESKAGGGRVTMILAPRRKPASATTAPTK